ncbi:hypothetical protein RISK_005278 [Rhodopirellula islandica]|uniref:Uncharacterized protein n=1 Tax=Rhodopirellula islandica TaxID=595434 RepID=A0A0J1B643_RHOIS|nr:hypothetical protein RISK_005278 [Rhodopirellula islandica]
MRRYSESHRLIVVCPQARSIVSTEKRRAGDVVLRFFVYAIRCLYGFKTTR